VAGAKEITESIRKWIAGKKKQIPKNLKVGNFAK
jgi:hypothetical protein